MVYEVNVKPARPAYNDRGVTYDISAKNKKEAISHARKRVAREMPYDRTDGLLIYTATEI